MNSPRRWTWRAAAALALLAVAAQGARADGDRAGARRDIDCRVERCVALTFDDGPGLYTDKLLKALDDAGARATFFVLGDVSAARPAALRKIAAAGHEIASHTWDHRALPSLTDAQVRAELTRSADVIERITGTRPELMRPPYGSLSSRVTGILGAREWPIILWSLDPEDWRVRNADTVYRRVIAGTQPGEIVLLHDIHATTVAAVPRILAALSDRGYTFVTVSELYNRPLNDGAVYYDRHDAYVGKKAVAVRAATTEAAPAAPGAAAD